MREACERRTPEKGTMSERTAEGERCESDRIRCANRRLWQQQLPGVERVCLPVTALDYILVWWSLGISQHMQIWEEPLEEKPSVLSDIIHPAITVISPPIEIFVLP